jgi:uncharacterized protein (TIGR02246 family)
MLRAYLIASLFAVFLSSGFVDAQTCQPNPAAEAKVRAVAEGIITADNKRDLKSVLSYYATDAILMPPGGNIIAGVDSIRPGYESLFANFQPEIKPRLDEVCVSEDFAFVRGFNGGRMAGLGSHPSRMLNDVYLMILRRDHRGDWRITELMWHPASSSPR